LYTGIISVSPATAKALSGAPDATTVDFGDIVAVPRFVVGHEKYRHLENAVFVGSGRFVVTPGEPLKVEYRISQVLA
jgi:surface antigen